MTQRSAIRRGAAWLLLGASLAGAVTFLGIRLVTPSDGGRIAFYEDAWSSAGVRIAPIDPPAPGLETGDRVGRIAGVPLEDWVRPGGEHRPPAGDAAIPYAVERDGAQVGFDSRWGPAGLGATLLEGWTVVVFSVVVAGVAAFVFARRPDEPAALALVVVAAGAAGSSVPWHVGITTSDLVHGGPFLLHTILTAGLYMVMWPGGIHLALVFPEPPPLVRRHRWLVPAAYAVTLGAYLALLSTTALAAPSALDWIGSWPRAQLAVIVPAIALWLVLFAANYRRTRDPVALARARWAALGGVGAAALGLALFQVPELLTGGSLLPPSWIGLVALLLPLGIAVGILRDRLFDIEVVLNRALVYGGMTVGVLSAYVVTVSALTTLAGREPGFGGSLLATGLAALVALPLRDALQRMVNRLMYGERDEPWRAIRRLGQRLEWAAEPERAFPAIVDTVAEALRSPYVALETAGADGAPILAASRGSPAADTVSVPLLHGAEPVGRLVIGTRAGERGFRADELRLLEDLARQAGTAVSALRLRDELARSREALVVAREEERRRLRRDLHDGLGPALAAIGMRAEASALRVRTDPGGAEAQLRDLGDEVGLVLADIRRLVDGLRPPALDELGLAGAIRQQAERLESRAGDGTAPRIAVSAEGAALGELPAAVEVAAYRIAVEAVTNAVRHAAAQTCRVRLEADDDLRLEIVDDGRGIAHDARPGIGLESMRNRAAELGGEVVVERGPIRGTRVIARLPIARGVPG